MPVLFQNFSFNGINMKNMQLDDWKSELGIACFTFFSFSWRFFFCLLSERNVIFLFGKWRELEIGYLSQISWESFPFKLNSEEIFVRLVLRWFIENVLAAHAECSNVSLLVTWFNFSCVWLLFLDFVHWQSFCSLRRTVYSL